MLARLTRIRLPLRRYIHTPPHSQHPQHPSNFSPHGFGLGAAVIASTYVAWRLTAENEHISLDSSTTAKQTPKATLGNDTAATKLDAAPSNSQPKASRDASSPFLPDDNADEPTSKSESKADDDNPTAAKGDESSEDGGAEGGGGGAYDPVTGEINWDCPCLGGMAHGPCGPEFREAFSCFIFSEDEPKGINCVEKFKAMQTCFREHPDVYGEEIMNDEDEDEEGSTTPDSEGKTDTGTDDVATSETASTSSAPSPSDSKEKPKPKPKATATTSAAASS